MKEIILLGIKFRAARFKYTTSSGLQGIKIFVTIFEGVPNLNALLHLETFLKYFFIEFIFIIARTYLFIFPLNFYATTLYLCYLLIFSRPISV